MSITVAVLTKNEENNIGRCLESLAWSDEIIVVDDYSQDKTLEQTRNSKLETRNKIKIYQRKLNADFAQQRNFALAKASSEWILFIDADEVIDEKLKKEIKNKISDSSINGYILKREDIIFGRTLRYGETANVQLVRLARRGSGNWEGRVHEVWKVNGKIGHLENPLSHYPHQTVSEFLKEVNCYTDLVAQYWREQGRKIGFWEIIFYPLGKFLQNYVLRLGFMDGTAGFVMAGFMSFHSYLARGKYWLYKHKS